MISISHLSKVYSQGSLEVKALQDVSLHVEAGQIFGVAGQSGAGKSTLIRCVNLLERPTSGTVVVAGRDITSLTHAQLQNARQNIGMIFQHFNLLHSRTVAGNIALPLEVTRMPSQERRQRVDELLNLVGLSDKRNVYPAQLSGGQKQRVGIARALATQPKVLLSDEATSALDPATTASILALLKDLNQRLGLTILLITHEMNVIKQICDHAAILEDGKVVEYGAVAQLMRTPGSSLSRAFFPPSTEFPNKPGVTHATITFTGPSADQPILASLIRQFDVEVNIIGGNIQLIAGERIGNLQIELSGRQKLEALSYLQQLSLPMEVH